jgi:hypothetical protein
MRWEVTISGSQEVLTELARQFNDEELGVTLVEANGQTQLRSTAFEGHLDAASVRIEAERIVDALSGISRLLLRSDSRLTVSSVTAVRPDGKRNIFLQVEPAVLKIRGGLTSIVVTRADGRVEEYRPSDPAPKWLARALANPNAARALRLRDTDDLSWTDLYRLYEVIEAGAGGVDAIAAKGWASKSQVCRFKHSANSVTVAGNEARHGVESTEPPAEAMSLGEARSFVDGLLHRWLENGAV